MIITKYSLIKKNQYHIFNTIHSCSATLYKSINQSLQRHYEEKKQIETVDHHYK